MTARRLFAIAGVILFTQAQAAWAIGAPGGPEPEPDCSREAGSLPDPGRPVGAPDPAIPVEHVLVIMQENHSFDNFFGRLNRPDYYGSEIDGIDPAVHWNPDADGSRVHAFPMKRHCVRNPRHSWTEMYREYNGGAMDGFVTVNNKNKPDGFRAMGYYDAEDSPYYYGLANRFAVADRYFASMMGPTYPNRYFLLTGTAFGHIGHDLPKPLKGWKQKTIFESLSEAGVSWKYYFTDIPVLGLFSPMMVKYRKNMATVGSYYRDLRKGKLPQVAFVESSILMGDEHPPFDFQLSQRAVERRIEALMKSRHWAKAALFLTYDEGGGFYDHVPPPKACHPDGIPPKLGPKDFPGDFDRLGFRVPFVAVSPWAKRHYVSHRVYDHTSILKFIETKFNIPALTRRDANADAMLDLFDFKQVPDFAKPVIPRGRFNRKELLACFNPFRKGPKRPK